MARKKKNSAKEYRVSAREVPTKELFKLFDDAFSTKKVSRESGNRLSNDLIPF